MLLPVVEIGPIAAIHNRVDDELWGMGSEASCGRIYSRALIQIGTNRMGYALLVKLLIPVLLKTAELLGSDVRVVVLTSHAHNYTPNFGIQFNTLKNSAEGMNIIARYGQSKLANLLWRRELGRHYPQLTVPIVHPGLVRTNPATTMGQSVDVESGTLNQLWAATSPQVESGQGSTMFPLGRRRKGINMLRIPDFARSFGSGQRAS
ncbi:hypothetical protein DPV78_011856 [Talaromyces pinophilus]|nr:hypothetical protein DPV78_011856 [Talaromyces pinophilus]